MAQDSFWQGPREFSMTRWSMVRMASNQSSAQQLSALNTLCEAYWYPVYAFVRRKGHDAETAKDLTQDFLSRWMTGPALARADEGKGKFRTFLLRALDDYLIDMRRRDRAQKRGGDISHISLDGLELEARYKMEPLSTDTPEVMYDRHFAEALLKKAQDLLHQEHAQSARAAFFHSLEPYLLSDVADGVAESLGQTFGMTRGAISASIFRARKRLKQLLTQELSETLSSPEDLNNEMHHLFSALMGNDD